MISNASGNRIMRLTRDDTRGIDTLKYAYGLARPIEVRFANGSRMINAFRADGTKISEGITLRYLETVETTAGTGQEGGGYKSHSISRCFYGSIVSEFETTARTTTYRIYNDAGYVLYDPKTGTGEYRYYIRDHLGNVRVEIDGDGNVVRAADYTASGIPIEKSWLTYPGSECYAGLTYYGELGNGWYDNNARLMESLTMRFTAMDPLCEKYPAISPYANCLCNPLRFSDPTGLEITIAENADEFDKEKYNHNIALLKKNKAFEKLYQLIDYLPNKTQIVFADEVKINGEIVPGAYNSETSTITLARNDYSNLTLAEELYHVYQNEFSSLNGITSNIEFEAKVALSLMAEDSGMTLIQTYSNDVNNYLLELYTNHESQINVSQYLKFGNIFSSVYKESSFGNSNYHKPVYTIPNTLINLFNIKK